MAGTTVISVGVTGTVADAAEGVTSGIGAGTVGLADDRGGGAGGGGGSDYHTIRSHFGMVGRSMTHEVD